MGLEEEIESYARTRGQPHGCGDMPVGRLSRIERLLGREIEASAETGCGASTIFLSRKSARHKVFCLDDRADGESSSARYFLDCPATRHESLEIIYGPTQLTLPKYEDDARYDLVLIDGPHGYPFPELEYFYFYPRLKPGALLVIDDIHIATVGRLADFIAEDRMFDLLEVIETTAVFRRTDAPCFDPYSDGWWRQDYNRRRAYFSPDFYLQDSAKRRPISFRRRDQWRAILNESALLRRWRTIWFCRNVDWDDVVAARSAPPVSGEKIRFQRNLVNVIKSSKFFDEKFYLRNNVDVDDSSTPAALHFLLVGGFEGRDPGPKFSTAAYLADHAQARELGLNPLLYAEIARIKKAKGLGLLREFFA
jgi:predicted O-methyltransferase YrrM